MQESSNSEIQITRFTIDKSSSDRLALNKSKEAMFAHKDIRLDRGREKTLSYHDINDLSRTLAIEISIKEGSEKKIVQLPSEMLARMAEYIRMQNNIKGGFDCSSFVHFVNGIPYDLGNLKIENWEHSPLEEKKLEPGSTIMITESKDGINHQPTHLAIYLGNGLYLSKFGRKGNLIATDLAEMKKGFGGEFVFKMIPAPGTSTLLKNI